MIFSIVTRARARLRGAEGAGDLFGGSCAAKSRRCVSRRAAREMQSRHGEKNAHFIAANRPNRSTRAQSDNEDAASASAQAASRAVVVLLSRWRRCGRLK